MTRADDTLRWRELDRRHHLHPFTNPAELASGAAAAHHHPRRGLLAVGQRGQPHPRRHGRPVVRQRRLRPRRAGRGGAPPDDGAALLQHLLPVLDAGRDRARRAARRARAAGVRARVLHELGLGGQRHRGQARALLLEPDGPAAEEDDHRPRLRLPRRDPRDGEPVRARGDALRSRTCRCRASSTSRRLTGTPRAARSRPRSSGCRRRRRSSAAFSSSGRRPSPPSSASRSRVPAG